MMTEYVLQQLINAMSVGSEYALLALGLAIVYSIVGLVNFAHGEIITVAGFSMFFATAMFAPNPLVLLFICLAGATLTALAFERVAFRSIRNASVNTGMLTAFGVSIIVQNALVIFVATRPRPVQTPAFLGELFFVGPFRVPLLQVLETGVTIVAIVALVALLRFTTIGLAMRAAAKDFTTVRLMGVHANRVIYVAFLISGFLAGIAAIFILSRRGAVDPFMGFVPVLKAFVACVVGGLGSLPGAVLGGFLLGVAEVLLQVILPTEAAAYRDALVFAMVGLLMVQFPQGLLGKTMELGDKES
jgi:branched-chain amino acid transport system permease protein